MYTNFSWFIGASQDAPVFHCKIDKQETFFMLFTCVSGDPVNS